MLLLALTCLRAAEADVDVMAAVLRGDVQDGLRIGLARLERGVPGHPERQAVLGQVMGRLLLGAGREEQAEELFQKQLRVYESQSRQHVRWLSSMDRGALFLALNKPGRAAETFNVVADCEEAPLALRLEALAGLATALHGVGEYRRASRTMAFAVQLGEEADEQVQNLLGAIALELRASRFVRNVDEQLGGAAHEAPERLNTAGAALLLATTAQQFAAVPIVAHRLAFLAALLDEELASTTGAGRVLDELRWWRERRLNHLEEVGRIEAALALVHRGNGRIASDILGILVADDTRLQHHRYAIELMYCASKLHANHGRYMDALRLFRQHAGEAYARLRAELMRVPYSRFLEQLERVNRVDGDQLRLPLRYRKAYQFILENLNEKTLSIRRVAAHIDVTVRALQMAFRTHLGMTPAEVIRRLRMECIRTELKNVQGRESVLAVASRWGMGSRSTLAQNYRQQFGETPASTSASVVWGEEDELDDAGLQEDLVADEA